MMENSVVPSTSSSIHGNADYFVSGNTMTEKCNTIVKGMIEKKIDFLAIDFDLTLCSIHTSGQYIGSCRDLALKLRPFMVELIRCALVNNLMVAIVTFSCQTQLITDVIHTVYPTDLANRVIVRCSDGLNHQNGKDGKQVHIAYAAERIASEFHVKVTRNSTLLIDDDYDNIRIALTYNIKSIWFDAEHPDPDKYIEDQLMQEFVEKK